MNKKSFLSILINAYLCMLTIVLFLAIVVCGLAALWFALMLSPWCFACIFAIPFIYVLFVTARDYAVFPKWFLDFLEALLS